MSRGEGGDNSPGDESIPLLDGVKGNEAMTETAEEASRPIAPPGTDHPPAAPHILIAEDHPAIQELLCWVLQLAGYRTTACAGRHATLTWRERVMPSGECPALILLDLSLLRIQDATDFLYRLRVRWHAACGVLPQIIVLTTSKQVQEALTPGECVILKPFHVRDLLALVQRVIPFVSRPEDCTPGKVYLRDR
jgi:two-component system response regulator (stage 0 sporulation protein F)/two-component system response regulator RpaA